MRGYSPLDTLRYREYLQFIASEDKPLRALDSPFSYPLLGDVPVKNRSLLDLLGVRYLLQPGDQPPPGKNWTQGKTDKDPVVYEFLSGGMQDLGPYTVFKNEAALPRAFVVQRARPLPPRPDVLATLTATDFRKTVLLEDWVESAPANGKGGPHSVRIRRYRPNGVELEVTGDAPGYLVLTDVWYPGWTCTVNGEPTRVYRANYLFRAVAVASGTQEVIFRFEPVSYRRGRRVTLTALGVVLLLCLVLVFRSRRRIGSACL